MHILNERASVTLCPFHNINYQTVLAFMVIRFEVLLYRGKTMGGGIIYDIPIGKHSQLIQGYMYFI